MQPLIVLSLFDGLGGAYQALKEAGIPVKKYYASEIDKFAIEICQKNHPDVIQLGSITDITADMFEEPIDLLIGGSPCQDLSIAKRNREHLNGSRSGLFFEFLRLRDELKPRFFLLENVASMHKDSKEEMTRLMGVNPILINSALLTAQNRKRLYWTNIPNITQPLDKQIYLKNVLEQGGFTEKLKSYCVTATYSRACARDYFDSGVRQMVFNKPVKLGNVGRGNSQGTRVYNINGKSVTLNANGGGWGAKTGLYAVAQRGRYKPDGTTEQKLEPRFDGKTNTLTTVQKDNYVAFREHIRRLTPLECERLQGLPDDYTAGVADSQRYRMVGNAFTVPVIAHILSFMNGKAS